MLPVLVALALALLPFAWLAAALLRLARSAERVTVRANPSRRRP